MNLQELQDALTHARALRNRYSTHPSLDSVISQLEYLIALQEGANSSRERLANISLGVIAAREIEGIDDRLSDMLYEIAANVKNGTI